MRRVVISCALVVGCLTTAADHARADATGHANTGTDGIDHGARTSGRTAGTTSGNSDCTYRPVDLPPGIAIVDVDGNVIIVDSQGKWYEKWCTDTGFTGTYWLARPRTPVDLATEAHKYLRLPLPQAALSPSGDQIVNLATWLTVDQASWAERRSTVSVPGVSVTVIARPEAVIWSLGDGTIVTCDGPGTTYDPSRPADVQTPTCAYTFARSSASRPDHAYAATVTVRWHATWTVVGAPGGGDLGVIERRTAFAIRVGEVQAINTAAR